MNASLGTPSTPTATPATVTHMPSTHHHTSPSPPPHSPAPPVIPPLYIDNLAREFGLGDRDRMKLRNFVQVVTGASGALSQATVAAHLYMLAVILSEAAERRRQEQEKSFVGDLRAMMRDLQIRLDDGFTLTTNQKANIRGITQDVIHESTRIVFVTLHVDVLVVLKSKAQLLDLDNIFGVPVREKKLGSALRRACSSVRNAFRQDIRDSIDPATFLPLEKFVYTLASKYKLGGVVGELSDLFTIHAALLRRFAFDHSMLLWIDEDEDDPESSPERPRKKRKVAPKQGGRIAVGHDFWGKADSHFQDEVAKRGRSFKDARWKPYIDQILADDKSKFAGMTPGVPVSALMLEDPVMPDASTGGLTIGLGQSSSGDVPPFVFETGGVGSWASNFSTGTF
ncbi:hypothetical protein C8R47DRAFT_1294448 [Mycena vitilis]|nr:hypothetical protein C8R47DRAFT_1294448 [Mycena vitilis]